MKKITLALLLVAATAFAGDVVKRGDAISKDAKTAALEDVMSAPESYLKTPVVVEGVISASCERQGCWMQLVPENAKDGVRVTFKDYGFFVPLDAKGMHARAEGVASIRTLPKDEVDHLESEGAKISRNADGSAREVSFVANGVELWK
ncbi:MAG TPA: DUF4920 domain-containing protein [Thermoanaerobaculia bacterium]|nr:DUF4920 domain-containing protein [Thermoanaerobaculia bacterium]